MASHSDYRSILQLTLELLPKSFVLYIGYCSDIWKGPSVWPRGLQIFLVTQVPLLHLIDMAALWL
jgi:hypothetical protein